MPHPPIRALLFDKDGTLTDFRATWEGWLAPAVRALAQASGAPVEALARVVGVDPESGRIAPHGAFVTATNAEMAGHLARATGWDAGRVGAWWGARAAGVEQVPVLDAGPFLAALRARGLRLGVLTNAGRDEAEAHLARLGAAPHLDALAACDDGHGAKPEPGGARAFARMLNLDPASVVLVGDGMTDMGAARAAGMRAVAVTTGTLDRAALAPHAEAVLDGIGALPGWLDAQGVG